MVKNLPSSAGDTGLIPGLGTKTPHALEQLSLPPATTVSVQQGKIPHNTTKVLPAATNTVKKKKNWTEKVEKNQLENCSWRDFPGSPVIKTRSFPLQGAQVQSLVRELRSHMLPGVAKKIEAREEGLKAGSPWCG